MIKTFNCGVGFFTIINKNNLNKINKFFLIQNLNLTLWEDNQRKKISYIKW